MKAALENFWYHYKIPVLLAAAILVAGSYLLAQQLKTVPADYEVALVSSEYYSDEQLESERKVAKREGYDIRVIKADMTKPLPFGDETFDIVFHPVANCYARKLEPIWRECYRVLKKGGIFIAGMDNGINFLFADDEETVVANHFPFDPITDPGQMEQMVRDNGGVQFSHTAEDNIGDQLKAGFRITDLYEDTNGSGRLHELNIPCFVVTRAVKE